MVRRWLCLGACLLVVVVAVDVSTAHAVDSGWVLPVDGAVVAPFDPPATKYGRGHLGVDLAAEPDTRVHAAGAGVVAFAGGVAGSVHVVVSHSNGLRTSYSFLAAALVQRGDHV